MADRINFFGLQDEKIYYDERKRRFFSNKDAPSYVMRSYKNSVFKEVSALLRLAILLTL
jgi:hypothetical protein